MYINYNFAYIENSNIDNNYNRFFWIICNVSFFVTFNSGFFRTFFAKLVNKTLIFRS